MLSINDNLPASLGFERSSYADMVRGKSARISKGLVFHKAKAPLTDFRFVGQFNRTLSNSGFFTSIDAICKYGRDNQPNDTSGSATRTRTGGNRGLMIDRVWIHFSLLGQAFNPEIEKCLSLSLP